MIWQKDGYPGSVLSEKEVALSNENGNNTIFNVFEKAKGEKIDFPYTNDLSITNSCINISIY